MLPQSGLRMQVVQDALDAAACHAQLAVVIAEVTQQCHIIFTHLATAGYAEQVLPHVLHAALLMESRTALRAPAHLAWRCTLAATVCQCYEDIGCPDLARKFVLHILADVQRLEATFAVDPVPQPPEVAAQIADAKTALAILRFKFEAANKPAPDLTTQLGSLPSPRDRLVALLSALSTPKQRVAQRTELSASMKGTWAALAAAVQPHIFAMQQELSQRKASAAQDIENMATDGGGMDRAQLDTADMPAWSAEFADCSRRAACAAAPARAVRCVHLPGRRALFVTPQPRPRAPGTSR